MSGALLLPTPECAHLEGAREESPRQQCDSSLEGLSSQSGSATERIDWIDMLKGVAITLVVLSHTAITEVQDETLYLFHMPLFFWLSGLLYRHEKYPTLGVLLRKRTHTLLIPYFCFAVIGYVIWFFVARHFGRDANAHIDPWLPVIGTFYSVENEPWLTHNTPLWFVTCLFIVEMLYWTLRRFLSNTKSLVLGLAACSAAGYLLSLYWTVRLPWGADVALTGVVFYGAGNLSWPVINAYSRAERGWRWLIDGAVVIVGAVAMWWGFGFVNMGENILGPGYFQFYAAAFGGIAFCFVLVRSLPTNRPVTFLGRNTLVILALQLPCFGLVKAIQQYGLGIDVESTRNSLLWGLIHTAAIIGLLIPVIFAIDRWAPFLKGGRRRATPGDRVGVPEVMVQTA